MIDPQLVDEIKRVASRRGYRFETTGDGRIRLWHENAPFYVEVSESAKGIRIRIGYESLKDYVREIVDTESDPRDFIEDIIDSMTALAHELYELIQSKGLKAYLEARDAAMDILEELEEALEES